MKYRLTIPARINILGNPSDALEGDFATISAAVKVYAGALVAPAENLILEFLPEPPTNGITGSPLARVQVRINALPFTYDDNLDLLKAAVNRMVGYSAELRAKLRADQGVQISVWSQVPRQSGLGGSSLLILLVLAGLRAFYNLDPCIHNDYLLAELTQRTEAKDLNITCGYADRYVPLFGGLAYIDYREKLDQRELNAEPYATYERLDGRAPDLPLIVVTSGIPHDSGDVHGAMRPRYLEEHAVWGGRGDPPPMVRFMRGAYEAAWRGKIALLGGDLPAFGHWMNTNHRVVNDMMTYCGFEDGAGWANNALIEAALAHGALGAKLTGAGGGGSVFALARPGEEDRLVAALEETTRQLGLEQASIFRPLLDLHGLVVERLGNSPG